LSGVSRLIESLARPCVIGKDLESAYREMAQEEEPEAEDWNGPRPRSETSLMKY
jgi:hypothetical protein